MVMVRIPAIEGNHAVIAVAAPSRINATMPSTCSGMTKIDAITPTARKPGISRTVCSQPMSEPSNWATSMTKLFNNADHVANASGMAAAIKNKSVKGRRQRGKLATAEIGSVWNIMRLYGSSATVARENVMVDKKTGAIIVAEQLCAKMPLPSGRGCLVQAIWLP